MVWGRIIFVETEKFLKISITSVAMRCWCLCGTRWGPYIDYAQIRGWNKTTRLVKVDIVVRALLIFVDVSVFILRAVDETAQEGCHG